MVIKNHNNPNYYPFKWYSKTTITLTIIPSNGNQKAQ